MNLKFPLRKKKNSDGLQQADTRPKCLAPSLRAQHSLETTALQPMPRSPFQKRADVVVRRFLCAHESILRVSPVASHPAGSGSGSGSADQAGRVLQRGCPGCTGRSAVFSSRVQGDSGRPGTGGVCSHVPSFDLGAHRFFHVIYFDDLFLLRSCILFNDELRINRTQLDCQVLRAFFAS